MSFTWPLKDKDEVLDYSVDWTRWLGGASIVSYEWYVDNEAGVKTLIAGGQVVNGIQNVAQTNSNGVVTIHLGLGTNNVNYKFYSRITDNTGSVGERVIRLRVKEY